MPQLVKGGKHVFGWSGVSNEGRICIPPEAFREYKLAGCDKAILMSGSKRSGGFGLTTVEKLMDSEIGRIIDQLHDLVSYSITEGEPVRKGSRIYCWVRLSDNGCFTVPPDTLRMYGIEPGQKALVARGSGLAAGFLARGPIIEEAEKHPELKLF
jgi:hypothetical protein